MILLKGVLFTAHWRCGKSRSPQIVLSKSNTSFQTNVYIINLSHLSFWFRSSETLLVKPWKQFTSETFLLELRNDFFIVKPWSLLREAFTISLFVDSAYTWLTDFLYVFSFVIYLLSDQQFFQHQQCYQHYQQFFQHVY